ncbi:MAG: 50S ribosomal protein L3 [Dehalococcoidia bacterium]|nr:50S ribosomal protein L3 [Dehalococcoidia bacterium]MDD5494633.1 50S ribosomal protein L3 [Dehalococcoidia bacterium]
MAGILGKKIGMTQLYRENREITVTAVEAGPCCVIQVKTADKDSYNAVQLGFGMAKRLNKPEKGHLKDNGEYKYLRELRIDDVKGFEVGQKIDVGMFKPGDIVNIEGVSKGKGFAGGVKRYHFRGGPKTHGQSDRHRAPGSIGSTTTPGRVFKGLRMAGHLGARKVTVRNLEIVDVDPAKHLLLLKGAVPGARGGLLIIEKAS